MEEDFDIRERMNRPDGNDRDIEKALCPLALTTSADKKKS